MLVHLKIFTQANRYQQRRSNHAVYSHHIREELLNSTHHVEKRKIRFNSKCKIKTSYYASPIEDEILQDMWFKPGYDLEKIVGKSEFFEKFKIDDFCSVHKAVVPISRMRVLLDQDDIGDTVSVRCPECLTSKKVQRSTAVSLQEGRKQVIIEQSLTICEDKIIVIAKYPFIRDPWSFL